MQALSNRQLVVLFAALYCAQGLPAGFLAHALPAILRSQEVDLAVIGALKLLALPWLLKVLWAPFVDRFYIKALGRHRSWILACQLVVIGLLTLLAALPLATLFTTGLSFFLAILVLINLACATQDIATDGLNVRLMQGPLRGLGNSLQVGGYKVGMLVSGSGLLLVVSVWGWQLSLGVVVLLLGLLLLPVLAFAEPKVLPAAAPVKTRIEDWLGLFNTQGFILWLLIVASYKLGDSLGSPMIKPMLVDAGLSLGQIGLLTFYSTLVGIAGAVLGGWCYARMGALKLLLVAGFAQALGLGLLALVAGQGTQIILVYSVALFEQGADGLSTVALFAAMMNMCRKGFEGTDYTLQACAQLLIAGFVGAASGVMAKAFGYQIHFLVSALVGIAVLPLVWWRLRKNAAAWVTDTVKSQG